MKKIMMMMAAIMMVMAFGFTSFAASSCKEEVVTVDDETVGCHVWLTESVVAACKGGEELLLEKGEKLVIEQHVNDNVYLCSCRGMHVVVNLEFALINIREYIPGIIINLDMAKKENMFSMAGEAIPGLSDVQFYTSESALSGDAWLRLPAAKMLSGAQKCFAEDGYCIKIYDAYRPFSRTMAFKAAYSNYLDGKTQEFKNFWFGKLGESWFLAQHASSHNFGVAVDMTLVSLETGEELEMPSRMHTLDKTSGRSYWTEGSGKDNAEYMREVMLSVGFSDLKSEWWHFQDNATVRNSEPIDLEF